MNTPQKKPKRIVENNYGVDIAISDPNVSHIEFAETGNGEPCVCLTIDSEELLEQAANENDGIKAVYIGTPEILFTAKELRSLLKHLRGAE